MLGPKRIKKEHKRAIAEMAALVQGAKDKGHDFPVDHGYELHCRLAIIKDVLEWVDTSLVTTDPKGRSRIEQLIGDCYYYGLDGPVNTEMVRRRV